MDYTGMLRPEEVPFPGKRYIKGSAFHVLRYGKG